MKKKSPLRRFSALLLTAVMVLCILPSEALAKKDSAAVKQELDALKQENAAIQAQINAIQKQYDANSDAIGDLVAQKDAVDQEIALMHSQVANLNEQIMALAQMIADSQDDLDAAENYLTELNQKHKQRIQAMEEDGKISYWQVLFQASSFIDLLDRMNMVEEIAASDQKRLDEIKEAAVTVKNAQDQMSAEKTELDLDRVVLQEQQAALEEKRTQSDSLLRQLAAKQEEFQALLDESEAMQDDLMADIAAKQKEYNNAQYEEKLAQMALKGQNPPSNATWITPVSGYVISSAFGYRTAPKKGASTYHRGIDMACAQGTPIYATRAGTVTVASYQAGGAGYYVAINHGDGFSSIYMHMTHYVVAKGAKVSAGQLIGYVGSTGVSTGPHLHFGISYAGTYVNPMAYI